jgi:hypothetical protein
MSPTSYQTAPPRISMIASGAPQVKRGGRELNLGAKVVTAKSAFPIFTKSSLTLRLCVFTPFEDKRAS